MAIDNLSPDDLPARAHLLYTELHKAFEGCAVELATFSFGHKRFTRMIVNLNGSYMLELIETKDAAAKPYLRAHTVHGGAYKHFRSGLFTKATLAVLVAHIEVCELTALAEK